MKTVIVWLLALASWPILGYMFLGGETGFFIGAGFAIAFLLMGSIMLLIDSMTEGAGT
jgi:hypothetical protein